MANPYQGGDVDYFSAARDEEGNIDKKKAAADVKAATDSADSVPRFKTDAGPSRSIASSKKPAIVTKEQMKKEGYDNLRDYLNFKQNKKRRPDSVAKPKAEAPKTEAPAKKEAPKPKAEAPVGKPGRSAVANRKRGKSDADSTSVKVAPGATSVERMRNTMKQKFGEKNKFGMKTNMKAGGMVKMKSGGGVKSIDGCALRGKTQAGRKR